MPLPPYTKHVVALLVAQSALAAGQAAAQDQATATNDAWFSNAQTQSQPFTLKAIPASYAARQNEMLRLTGMDQAFAGTSATSTTQVTFVITSASPPAAGTITAPAGSSTVLVNTNGALTYSITGTLAAVQAYLLDPATQPLFGSVTAATYTLTVSVYSGAPVSPATVPPAANLLKPAETTTVTVSPQSLIALPDSGLATQNIALNGNVLVNDTTTIAGATLSVTGGVFNPDTLSASAPFSTGVPTPVPGGAGMITLNSDGSFVFTPAAGFSGPVPPIGYTVAASNVPATTDQSTLYITVARDLDGDGSPDHADTDDDGNGIPDAQQMALGPISSYLNFPLLNPSGGRFDLNVDGTTTVGATIANFKTTDPSGGVLRFNVVKANGTPIPGSIDFGENTPGKGDPAGSAYVSEFDVLFDQPSIPKLSTDPSPVSTQTGSTETIIYSVVGAVPAGFLWTVASQKTPGTTIGPGPLPNSIVVTGATTGHTQPQASYQIYGNMPVEGIHVKHANTIAAATNTVQLSSISISTQALAIGAKLDTDSRSHDTNSTGNVLTNDTVQPTATVTTYTVAGVAGTFTAGGTPAVIPGVGTLSIATNGAWLFDPLPTFSGPIPQVIYSVGDAVKAPFANTGVLFSNNAAAMPVPAAGTVSADPYYAMVGSPGTFATTNPTVRPVVSAAGSGTSNVIGLGSAPTVSAVTFPAGDYVFETTFFIPPGTDLSTVNLAFAASTGATVTLNGGALSNTGSAGGINNYSVAAGAGIQVGVNRVQYTLNKPTADTTSPTLQVDNATLTYQVTAKSTLDITIGPVHIDDGDEVNSTAINTTLSVAAGTPAGLLSNAVDPSGHPLTITGFRRPGDTADTPAGTSIPVFAADGVTPAGTLTINADGSYTFAANGYVGPLQPITYTVSDGTGNTNDSVLNLTTTPLPNLPPVDGDESNSTAINTPLSVAATAPGGLLQNATDPNGNPLTITGVRLPGDTVDRPVGTAIPVFAPDGTTPAGTLTINPDGSYTFVPATGYVGPVRPVTYTVSDGLGGTDTSVLNLTVTPTPNLPPVDGDESNSTTINTPLSVAATAPGGLLQNATDPNGNPLTITGVRLPGDTADRPVGTPIPVFAPDGTTPAGTLTINPDGSYTFVPATGYVGPVQPVTYTISNGHGGTDTSVLTLTVTPAMPTTPVITPEDTPVPVPGVSIQPGSGGTVTTTVTVTNGTATVTTGGATVTGNGSSTITITGTPTQVNDALKGLTFTNTPDFNGPAWVTVTPNNGTPPQTVPITVTPVVDVTDDVRTTPLNTPITIPVLDNDSFENPARVISEIDGKPVTVGTPTTVANGTVTVQADNTVIFTPNKDYTGQAVFTYTVSAGGVKETANVTITISGPVTGTPQAVPVGGGLVAALLGLLMAGWGALSLRRRQ